MIAGARSHTRLKFTTSNSTEHQSLRNRHYCCEAYTMTRRGTIMLGAGALLIGTSIGGVMFGVLSYGSTHGLKRLDCRVSSDHANGPAQRIISLSIRSPKDGFLVVLEITKDMANIVEGYSLGRPVFSSQEVTIEGCQVHPNALVLVAVTQTPICNDAVSLLSQDIRQASVTPSSDGAISALFYLLLQRRGHSWVALAEVSGAQKVMPGAEKGGP